jgi:hypothetical protein
LWNRFIVDFSYSLFPKAGAGSNKIVATHEKIGHRIYLKWLCGFSVEFISCVGNILGQVFDLHIEYLPEDVDACCRPYSLGQGEGLS